MLLKPLQEVAQNSAGCSAVVVAVAYASGQPGQTSLEAMLVEINEKEPQFRRNNQRLLALREWASSGNASFVREVSSRLVSERTTGDRLVNFAD